MRVAVAVLFGWAWLGADRARRAEGAWQQALRVENDLTEIGWLGSNEQFTDILGHAATASDLQPRDINYRHWLNVYRWRAISRVSDPCSGDIVVTAETLGFTQRIVDELHQARVQCPTFGATYSVAGQLEAFILEDPDIGAEHVRRGYQLAPYDATTCFTAGLFDAREGKVEASLAKFARAVQLDGAYFREVVGVYVFELNRPDLAVSLAGDDYSRLGHVARVLSDITEHHEIVERVRDQVALLLASKCQEPDAPASALAALGSLCARQGDHLAAIKHYQRALTLDYGNTYWRLALARSLRAENRLADAMHEAKICLRLRPQMTAARRMIEQLSVMSP